jgi:uncharacterized protein
MYLGDYRDLSFEKPGGKGFTRYTSDPAKPVPFTHEISLGRSREYMIEDQRFAARRPDVIVFESEELEADLTLAGTVVADLKVSLSTTDADFVVKIIDVFPQEFRYDSAVCCKGVRAEDEMGGYQMLVRGEIMRGKYRNSFAKPEAFVPGKITTVKFELPDVAHTFKTGHRIMIQIQSSWFPLFDRNPQQFTNIYKCEESAFVPCDIKIFHSGESASNIILPVLQE